jgi:hypothetical protein
MLEVLLASRGRRATADGLRREMRIDDESVDNPEQVVKDTASALRDALRKAACLRPRGRNPLPSTGRGRDLAYHLALS